MRFDVVVGVPLAATGLPALPRLCVVDGAAQATNKITRATRNDLEWLWPNFLSVPLADVISLLGSRLYGPLLDEVVD